MLEDAMTLSFLQEKNLEKFGKIRRKIQRKAQEENLKGFRRAGLRRAIRESLAVAVSSEMTLPSGPPPPRIRLNYSSRTRWMGYPNCLRAKAEPGAKLFPASGL
jgi:hypothetical protein